MPEEGLPLSAIKVVNKRGEVTSFSPDHFAGSLLRAGASPQVATSGSEIVGALLVGAGSAKKRPGSLRVSTDTLGAIHAFLVKAPAAPDVQGLSRLLLGACGKEDENYDSLPATGFYQAICLATDTCAAAKPRFTLLGTFEQIADGKRLAQQRLVKVVDGEGRLSDVTCGEVNAAHRMSTALPFEMVPHGALVVDSVAGARDIFARVHPLFADRPDAVRGSVSRFYLLSNMPDRLAWAGGGLEYVPTWSCLAVSQGATVLAMMNAMTGEVDLVRLYSTTSLVLLANSMIILASWGGFFHGVVKIAEIVVLGLFIGGETIGGLASSPTVIGPLIAALLIMLTLAAMIKKFIDLLEEVLGQTEADKLNALLDKINKNIDKMKALLDKMKRGEIDKDEAKRQMDDLLNDTKNVAKEAKELASGSGADDAVGALNAAEHIAEHALGGH